MLIALCSIAFVACNNNNEVETISKKESELQKVMKPYVENTVIATYSNMATEGLTLLEKCEGILEAQENSKDYTTLMKEAGEAWRRMRVYWEQSEAFLFGPAAKHNIDPHIDSWPLDFNAMNSLLSNVDQMKDIEETGVDYVKDHLGYALQGFHACEYLLFQDGQPHATNLTHAQAIYLLGVVEDLVEQAILLEDSWAGGVSAAKEAVITDDEGESMSYDEYWAEYFLLAGQAGSIYKTNQEAAEEIIAGCVDIAGEVANLKLGNPYRGSDNGGDSEYLESPYSRTSTTDFADNIRSILHAYAGAKDGDASISDYVKSQDADLDAKVRKTIDEAIDLLGKIVDFETTAQNNPQVKAAIDKIGELESILDDDVMALLAK